MSGLFSIFNVATRGMSAQQQAINVTSHNIANANTDGFSRQRAVIETTTPFGMPSLNTAAEPGQIGTGAQVAAISRVRDNFLDYQVRVETSTQGEYQARDTFLDEVQGIFNEPSDNGISSLVGKFFDSWQQLSKQPQSSDSRTVVAQQSAALTDDLNHTAISLDKLKDNVQTLMKDSVFQVNGLLKQLDDVNQQIIGVKVSGNMPNDLMDKRDLLIDQLSSKFNITIDKKNFEGTDIKPVDDSGLQYPAVLKSEMNSDVKRFSYISNIQKTVGIPGVDNSSDVYKITYYKNGDMSSEANKVDIYVNGMGQDQVKELDETRVLWADKNGLSIGGSVTEDGTIKNSSAGSPINFSNLKLFKPSSGELKGYMSVQSDVDDYKDQINKLAKAIAFSVNAVHSGKADAASDKLPFFVNSDDPSKENEITAENISVNKDIMNDVMKIKTRTNDDQFDYASDNNIDGETDGSRALAIAQLRDKLIKIQNVGTTINSRQDLFDSQKGGSTLDPKGLGIESNTEGMTIDNYFKDTVDRLGVQSQEAKRMVQNQQDVLANFQQSRESVSGVSVDEEMANLIQYQHAYQANAKVISTVDQLLDVVINGLVK